MGFCTREFLRKCVCAFINQTLSNPQLGRGRATCLTLSAVIVLAVPSFAQPPLMSSANDLTQAPIPGSGHDYQQLLGETVNFANGSVSFKITFPTPSSRGISTPASWTYNSSAVNTLDSVDGFNPYWNYAQNYLWPIKDGWNLADGSAWGTISYFQQTLPTGPPGQNLIPCNYVSGITFTDSGGVTHNIPTAAVAPQQNGLNDDDECGSTPFVMPPAGDGQVIGILPTSVGNALASLSPSGVGQFIVEDKNGTIYSFSLPLGQSEPLGQGSPNTIEDRNGNYINGFDTSGRSGPTGTGSPATGAVTYVAEGGTYSSTWGSANVSYTVARSGGGGSGILCGGFPTSVVATKTVLSTLTLPNGKEYQLFYNNSYGLLSEIIFPDGGWIKYTYQLVSGYNEQLSIPGDDLNHNRLSYGCVWQYQTPVLTSRTVSFDGTNVAQTQTLAYTTTWQYSGGLPNGWTNKTTTVTTTDNKRNLTSKIVYSYGYSYATSAPYGTSSNAAQIPQENSITYYDWGKSTPMKVVSKTWYDNFNLASETTMLYTNSGTLTSKSVYSYSQNPCNNVSTQFTYPLEQDDYDFTSSTTPVKKTKYNYKCFSPSNPSSYSAYWQNPPSNWLSYEGIVVPPKLYSVVVENGAGNIVSATQYNYDESGLSSVSPTHYDSAYSSVAARGNLTSVLRCNPAPTTQPTQPSASSPICTAGPKTTYTFDTSGQPASMTDPKGNTTHFSFADQFTDSSPENTNAYLTNVTYPSANGVILQKNFKYSYTTGYVTQSIDENSHTTSYTYNDPLHRLTETDFPDGGQTTTTYNDSTACVLTSKLLDSSNHSQTSQSCRDGLLHVVKTQLTSDPDSPNLIDEVDTVFDGEGQVFTQTNPFHPTATSATDGTTTSYLDALGRPIETVKQDGSTTQMCYDGMLSTPAVTYCSSVQLGSTTPHGVGTRVDTTDERGNHWQHVSDAFGRLFQVMEPNGSTQTPAMETDYAYDTMNDLLSVMQWGGAYNSANSRQRSFSYDNISRLTSAGNPETGAITYAYLNGGSLCSGDPSLPCTRTDVRNVVTTYAYDPDNRLTGKTYTDGTTQAIYVYDGTGSNPPVTNALGRLSLVSNGYNNSTGYGYDTMGRTTTTLYMLPSVCCLSANQVTTSVLYDYGGRPTQITYPDGRVVNETWNTANHLTNVKYSKWNTTNVNYNYMSTATYWPDGAAETMGLGNGVFETYSRNRRLQPVEILAALGSSKLLDKQICYGPTNDPAAPFCTTSAGSDNGNIARIQDTLNNNNTQVFTYDTLNRLATFANVGNTMQQTFTIDPWGNLSQSGTMSSVLAFGTNNRITTGGYGYDGAGNLNSFFNGVSTTTYAYDAEDRITGINSGADTYVYSASGDRIRKNVGSSWTEYAPLNGSPITEKNSNGTWTDYVFANGQRIAMAASSDQSNPSATTNYYSSDQIGSARIISNGSGGVVSSYVFYPFGQGAQPDENHYLFTGKERDSESGLDEFGARYLTSTMGRFMSPDWSSEVEPVPYSKLDDPQSLNLYSYVQNNPLVVVDPDGHCSRSGDTTQNAQCLADAVEDYVFGQGGYLTGTRPGDPPAQQQSGQALTAKPVKDAPKGTSEIQWQLSKKSKSGGYIVQEITTTDPSGKQTYQYWEAWQVSKGSKGTIYNDQGYNYDDMFRDPSGTTVNGNARFYERLQLPASFAPHSPGTIAGDLPATSVNPNLPTTNATAPVVRVWTAP